MQPEEARTQLEARYRTMLILWAALLLTVGFYFALSVLVAKPDSEDAPSRTLTFALTAVGVLLVIVSFAVKQKFLAQAEKNQAPSLVQTGLIIALAFREAASYRQPDQVRGT
ncbi:MAG TPA: hypothetical protein VE135_00760 [Pyrinomonadaceae bacterium]|nr:hypothetical protein [Pyrinomonadaceae bacterium]